MMSAMSETRHTDFALDGGGPFLRGCFATLEDLPDLAHGVSTREGPDFALPVDAPDHARAARQLARSLGLAEAAWLRQVHGGAVHRVEDGGLAGDGDALITDRPGLALLARSADCPLVLAAALDARGRPRAVGIAHASWKGTVARVTEHMLDALLALPGTERGRLRAAIAPSAGPCCYEVGPEVREAALAGIGPQAGDFFRPRGERLTFDLWRANVDQLERGGLTPAQVALAGVCTICEDEHFHSWRRDGAAAGRFAAAIGIRA